MCSTRCNVFLLNLSSFIPAAPAQKKHYQYVVKLISWFSSQAFSSYCKTQYKTGTNDMKNLMTYYLKVSSAWRRKFAYTEEAKTSLKFSFLIHSCGSFLRKMKCETGSFLLPKISRSEKCEGCDSRSTKMSNTACILRKVLRDKNRY